MVTVAEVKGRAVALEAEGHDGVDTICRAGHHRFVFDVKATEARLAAKAAKGGAGQAVTGTTARIPTYCYQCVAGPTSSRSRSRTAWPPRSSPTSARPTCTPAAARCASRPTVSVQKTYNPHRVLTPMKRTNPNKGRERTRGFVPISWDEALGLVAAKLNQVRADGMTDASGYPRVAVRLRRRRHAAVVHGDVPRFPRRVGPVDMGFGSGQGVKCYHSEHLYGEFWHRAFTVSPDTPHCDYLISCGANVEASGGVVGVWRHANARVRA